MAVASRYWLVPLLIALAFPLAPRAGAALIDLAPQDTDSFSLGTEGSTTFGRGVVVSSGTDITILGVGVEGYFTHTLNFEMAIIQENWPASGQDTTWRSAVQGTGTGSTSVGWFDFVFDQPFTLIEDVPYLVLFRFHSSPLTIPGVLSVEGYLPAFPKDIVDSAEAPITLLEGRAGLDGKSANLITPHFRLIVPEPAGLGLIGLAGVALLRLRRLA